MPLMSAESETVAFLFFRWSARLLQWTPSMNVCLFTSSTNVNVQKKAVISNNTRLNWWFASSDLWETIVNVNHPYSSVWYTNDLTGLLTSSGHKAQRHPWGTTIQYVRNLMVPNSETTMYLLKLVQNSCLVPRLHPVEIKWYKMYIVCRWNAEFWIVFVISLLSGKL